MSQNNFSENLKNIRKQRGMTQKELAELLNVSVMTIRRLEAGTRVPKLITVEKLSKALEVDPTELMFGDDVYIKTAEKFMEAEQNQFSGYCNLDDIESIYNLQAELKNRIKTEGIQKIRNETFNVAASNNQTYEEDNYKKLIENYNKLNTLGKDEAIKRVEELTEIPKYTTPDEEENPR